MKSATTLARSRLVIGFEGLSLPAPVYRLLREGLAGVVLFSRNVESESQVSALCRSILEASLVGPPIIAVDEEGGRVQRLRRIIGQFPSAREVGKLGPKAAYEQGRKIGEAIARLGFNVNLAPVLDVDSNPSNPVIGDRAFSSDPEVVRRCGLYFLRGLRDAKVLACLKHFPGHGDTSVDSHLDLPVVDAPLPLLQERELLPYRGVLLQAPLIMTAHCLYPELDQDLPATFSRTILWDLLRLEIGYRGCVVTDDLAMKAVKERFSFYEMVSFGLEAGVDLFLYCAPDDGGLELLEALERAAFEDKFRDAFMASEGRLQRLRKRLRALKAKV